MAILDADKEGFLRSQRSLIQTAGRAARNLAGRVILYADRVTGSIAAAISEMERRREKQQAYNLEHGITPQSVVRRVQEAIEVEYGAEEAVEDRNAAFEAELQALLAKGSRACDRALRKWEKAMHKAARQLDFEQAAVLRDRIARLQREMALA